MDVPALPIEPDLRIRSIRGIRVMLDRDLARIYGVSTKRLNEQVRRNRDRFPEDFIIRLTDVEVGELDLQQRHSGRGGRRHRPNAFTEHGAVMLASVLNTPFAVQAGIAIARAFIRLRRTLAGNKELSDKLLELECRIEGHDGEIRALFETIRDLMAGPEPGSKSSIGFRPGDLPER